MPPATLWGLTALVVTGVLTLLLNTGVGDGTAAELLALIGLVGLIASFFTIIYAYGRTTHVTDIPAADHTVAKES